MVYAAGIGVRFIELGLIGALLISAGLLFSKRRPAVLTLWGALSMAGLAAHLYLEGDRWQMIPAYLILFVLAIWVALPARRAYRAGGLILRVFVAVLALVAAALPVFAPLFALPHPKATAVVEDARAVGTALLYPESDEAPSPVQIWYPTEEPTDLVAPFWRESSPGRHLPGYHPLFASHFSLVPTHAFVRAPVAGDDLPLLLVIPGGSWLPGDYHSLQVAAAASGWLVAEVPGGTEAPALFTLLEELTTSARDAAIAGRVSRNRIAVLTGNQMPELGFPRITIADGGVTSVHADGSGARLSFPEGTVPELALTERHRFVLLPSLLIGSSDVPPSRAQVAATRFALSLLADGTLDAPLFGTTPPSDELLGEGLPGAVTYRRANTGR